MDISEVLVPVNKNPFLLKIQRKALAISGTKFLNLDVIMIWMKL